MTGVTRAVLRAGPLGIAEELCAFLPARPRVATERVVAALHAARVAWRAHPVVALSGTAAVDGRPLRVVTDLHGESLAYWTRLLFDGPPASQPLGVEPPTARLARRDDADLTLMSHHRGFRHRARQDGWLTVPSWLDTGIPLHESMERTLAAQPWGTRSRDSDLRRIRRSRLRPAVARGPAVVRAFLRDWYLPYVDARWGETCVHLDPGWRHRAERYCEVLWVLHEHEPVAGVLLEDQRAALRMVVIGMTDPSRRRDGALPAAYYFAMDEGVRRGRRWLRTGGTRPVLSDGVLQFKRKWGAHLSHVWQNAYVALRCGGWTSTLRAHFARHPVVAEAKDGEFLACTDPSALRAPPSAAARAMFDVGGLAGVLVPAKRAEWIRAPIRHAAPANGAGAAQEVRRGSSSAGSS